MLKRLISQIEDSWQVITVIVAIIGFGYSFAASQIEITNNLNNLTLQVKELSLSIEKINSTTAKVEDLERLTAKIEQRYNDDFIGVVKYIMQETTQQGLGILDEPAAHALTKVACSDKTYIKILSDELGFDLVSNCCAFIH